MANEVEKILMGSDAVQCGSRWRRRLLTARLPGAVSGVQTLGKLLRCLQRTSVRGIVREKAKEDWSPRDVLRLMTAGKFCRLAPRIVRFPRYINLCPVGLVATSLYSLHTPRHTRH